MSCLQRMFSVESQKHKYLSISEHIYTNCMIHSNSKESFIQSNSAIYAYISMHRNAYFTCAKLFPMIPIKECVIHTGKTG